MKRTYSKAVVLVQTLHTATQTYLLTRIQNRFQFVRATVLPLTASCLFSICIFIFCIPAATGKAASPQNTGPGTNRVEETPAESDEIKKLIEQLGSNDFQKRQQASERLLESGKAAIEALQRARLAEDSEIRFHANRILALIEQRILEKQIEMFLAGEADVAQNGVQPLIGWTEFSNIAGTDESTRILYARIFEKYHPLLKNIRDGAWHSDSTLSTKEAELFSTASINSVELLYKAVAASFLMTIEHVSEQDTSSSRAAGTSSPAAPNPRANNSRSSANEKLAEGRNARVLTTLARMSDTRLRTYVENSGFASEFDTVISAWVKTLPQDDILIAMRLVAVARQIRLPGISDRLAGIAAREQFSIQTRCAALQALATSGSPQDARLIRELMDSDASVGSYAAGSGNYLAARRIELIDGIAELVATASENEIMIDVKLADVALLTSILLCDQEPREFGFRLTNVPADERNNFSIRESGYTSSEDRVAAMNKWRTVYMELKRTGLQPTENDRVKESREK